MTDQEPQQGLPLTAETRQRWLHRFRMIILAVFALLTIYGVFYLVTNDWQTISAYWFARRTLLLAAFMLSVCDICTDGCIWMFILRQHGIRLKPARGLLLFLTGYAGHLMPVQLGRFFRATELTRLHGISLATSTTAELTLLSFVVISCISLFVGALLRPWSLVAAVLVPVFMIVASLFTAESLFHRIPKLPLRLPKGYWLRPSTFILTFMSATGWILNSTILYLIFKDVTELLHLHQTVMIVTSNLFIGVSSGLPGGLGISESYIGGMMYWLETPPEHLVIAVAAFRIITFWLWIPIGWAALLLNSLVSRNKGPVANKS